MRGPRGEVSNLRYHARPPVGLHSLWRFVAVMLIGAGFLGACAREEKTPLNIDLSEILPREWTPEGIWQPINIDADMEQEYLLFYHYDASTNADGASFAGPMGAVIYDPQTPASAPDATSDGASPPAPWLQPYALLPSYWRGAGYGFVAPPTQQGTPAFQAVKRVRPEEVENRYFEALAVQRQATQGDVTVEDVMPDQLPATDELIVFGGSSPIGGYTHISLFWWSNAREGYGSTQISAPGGLTVMERDDPENPSPIRKIRARYPQNDRSVLCKESFFTRFLDPDFTSPDAYRPAVYYVEGPRSLIFCYGIPDTPFYPEGVVLAYLLDKTGHAHLVEPAQRERIAGILRNGYRVDGLQAFATVDYFASSAAARSTEKPILTKVWANLVYQSTDPETGEEREERPLFQFTLRHVPSSSSQRTTDQWMIIDVKREG